jgi:branched-chain amino acid transport system permease protein
VFAHYQQYISPNGFDVNESILILTISLIGGVRNVFGPILGSLVVIGLPQLLTFVPSASTISGPLQQLLYGLLLVMFMLFRPQGLLNEDYKWRKGMKHSSVVRDLKN